MMKIIKEGIVFSNDIKRILEGKNSLNYNYSTKGFILPSDEIYSILRQNFKNTTESIFSKVTIITEEEMTEGLTLSLNDVIGVFPHCLFRSYLFIS